MHLGRGIVSGYIQKKSLARPVTIVFLEELTGVPMYRWLKTYIEADELPAGPQKTHLPALHEPGAAYTGAATVNNTPLPSLLRDLSDRLRALEDRVGELENCQ